MTRDDIIRMAREANCTTPGQVLQFTIEELERFAAFVAAAEREACAKVCEEWYASLNVAQDGYAKYGVPAVAACAADIRARGET